VRCRPRAQCLKACSQPYIEALLVDEELADLVWEAWDAGKVDDEAACIGWMLIAMLYE